MANIETKHLQMVSWSEELAFAALYDRENLARLVGARVPDDFPNDPVRKYVLPAKLERLKHDKSDGQWSGIIVHTGDGIIIGSMGFKTPPDEDGMAEMGYDIIEAYQGRGYATEMARAFVEWAFGETSITRVTAECLSSNFASIRVLEKVGMRRVEKSSSSDAMLYWEICKA